jgi:hypothetical protein
MNLLEPMKHLKCEFRIVLGKLEIDSSNSKELINFFLHVSIYINDYTV